MSTAADGSARDVGDVRLTADTHRVIKGRRWRVSDPALDETTRQHLVDELMDARRAVKAALAGDDADAEAEARARVNDAKVALGERGPKWWESMSSADTSTRIDAFVRAIGDRLGEVDTRRAAELLRIDAAS